MARSARFARSGRESREVDPAKHKQCECLPERPGRHPRDQLWQDCQRFLTWHLKLRTRRHSARGLWKQAYFSDAVSQPAHRAVISSSLSNELSSQPTSQRPSPSGSTRSTRADRDRLMPRRRPGSCTMSRASTGKARLRIRQKPLTEMSFSIPSSNRNPGCTKNRVRGGVASA